MYAEILQTTGSYTDAEVALFERVITERRIAKQEFLLKKGDIARHIYYLLEGAIRQYETKDDGEETSIDLHIAGEWFLDHESLLSQRPARTHIQAFSDSQVISISLDAIHYLTGKSISFLQLNRVLEGAFTKFHFWDPSLTPLEKYHAVLNQRPELIRIFPLKMIASFLRMSPETLSRVRNTTAKRNIS